jgi:serine/threonine protein kinase
MRTAPREIGPYLILDTLGDGGTGIVMRASHPDTGAVLAVKIPKHESAAHQAALRREVGVLQRIARAHIRGAVKLIEHGEQDGLPWYAMELIDGPSLHSWSRALWQSRDPASSTSAGDTLELGALSVLPPLPSAPLATMPPSRGAPLPRAGAGQLERVLHVCLCLAETVAQLHSDGIVHGDITPGNVVMRREGDPALIDFGTALVADAAEPYRERSITTDNVRGTPGYLSPESLLGELPDARGDLFSLGCVLYELLTGRAPFAAARVEDVLRRQLRDAELPLSQCVDGVAPELERVVHRLLIKDPGARLAHADEVCRVLCASLSRPPRSLRPINPHPPLLRTRLHGRAGLLEQLERLVLEAQAGRGGIAVVTGATGTGKSRVLRELGRRAKAHGARVLTGQGELVLRLASTDVRLPFNELSDTLSSGSHETRGATLRRAFLVLEQAAAASGMVLLLDDLDRADELSLAFLERYEKELTATRVLVVASTTTRSSTTETRGFCDRADASFELSPLSAGECRDVVRDLLGADALPDGLLQFVAEHAGGNPLFIAEYVRAAITRGHLTRSAGGWAFVPDSSDVTVPGSIRELFELRLENLSGAARRAVSLCSIFNHEFDAPAFDAVTLERAHAPEILEELVAHGIFEISNGHFRFAHEQLRASQESLLPEAERIALHRRAAEYGEEQPGGTLGGADTRGYHFARAGESVRAVAYLESAAREANNRHAPQRAAELLRLAVAHCVNLPQSDERDRRSAALEEALADALVKRARHREARERLETALSSPAASDPLWRARLLRKLASSCSTTHDYVAAANYCARAETELHRLEEPRSAAWSTELIQIHLGRFDLLYFSGKLGPELDALVEALGPLIDAHGSSDQASTYYFMAASHAFLRHRYAFDERALSYAEAGVRAAEASGNQRRGMAEFILGGALLLGTRAQCERALPHFASAAVHATRHGDATLLSRVRTYEAVARLRLGEVDAVAAAAKIALEAGEAASLAPYVAAARACHGWVAWRRGDTKSAHSLLTEARAQWKTHPHRFPFSNLAVFPLLDMACTRDDFETAAALLDDLPSGLPALPHALADAALNARASIQHAPPREAGRVIASVLALAREAALV